MGELDGRSTNLSVNSWMMTLTSIAVVDKFREGEVEVSSPQDWLPILLHWSVLASFSGPAHVATT